LEPGVILKMNNVYSTNAFAFFMFVRGVLCRFRLPVYISLALNYLQNKIIFSDIAKIIGKGWFSSKVPVGRRLYKKG